MSFCGAGLAEEEKKVLRLKRVIGALLADHVELARLAQNMADTDYVGYSHDIAVLLRKSNAFCDAFRRLLPLIRQANRCKNQQMGQPAWQHAGSDSGDRWPEVAAARERCQEVVAELQQCSPTPPLDWHFQPRYLPAKDHAAGG